MAESDQSLPFGMKGTVTPDTSQNLELALAENDYGMQGKPEPEKPVQNEQPGQAIKPDTQAAKQPENPEAQSQDKPAQPEKATLLNNEQIEQPADPENLPVTDFASLDLGLPEGSFRPEIVASFGEVATAQKLTPAQIKAVAKWQVEQIASAEKAYLETQRQALQAAWGDQTDTNCKQVVELCSRIAQNENLKDFAQELANSGAANNAVVIQGLFEIAKMLGEDHSGALNGNHSQTESALDGLMDVYNRARGRK